MRKVSVFDLDKTLACCNVSFAFGRFLYRQGYIPFFCMGILVLAYGLHKAGLFSIEKLHTISFRLFFYKKESRLVQSELRTFLDENEKHLFRPCMLEELARASLRGDQLWIQSSSPEFIVGPIAKSLGVSHSIGTQYSIDHDGKFCGIVQIINGSVKRTHLLKFLQDEGLLLQNVTAYSDSILDLPLLETVGNPVAVCPDRALRKIALIRKWPVIEAK